MTSHRPHGRVSGASVDALLALLLGCGAVAAAIRWPGDRPTDPLGLALLGTAYAANTWRRRHAAVVLAVVVLMLMPYNLLGFRHEVGVPAALLALGTFASQTARTKALLVGLAVFLLALTGMAIMHDGEVRLAQLGVIGWIIAAAVAGQAWRGHRIYVTSIIDRAERAERTRDEEARRRVAEERLRIARDLHDLLAHSITLIGVQAGVAAHLAAQPKADRAVLAGALETIADACRTAREEVRATLRVLRAEDVEPELGALPGLQGLADLAETVRSTGVEVDLTVDPRLVGGAAAEPGPQVGVAAYRIVQEALTNVVRHADAERVVVNAERVGAVLRLTVHDDGPGGEVRVGGFGIMGMTERARSVGGSLTAGPAAEGGFRVRALLPLSGEPAARGELVEEAL
ncbi:sensor histidine kinase [Yinghuangia seranimata]|uniref:sensor histidine kinase n=1 Tax=Yinghuangia seranimata TaxID=408067 RepID=UPI00248BA3F5|nr:sensor histidine kinase [Yinghuangia seranimata]MDI2131991.1 sensor histidine kinase [Yinghuangia seranimata]